MLCRYYDNEYTINSFNEDIQRRGVKDNFVELDLTVIQKDKSEREKSKFAYRLDAYSRRDKIPGRVVGKGKKNSLKKIYRKLSDKIVIYGSPGTGKTVLCKKIVYDFYKGNGSHRQLFTDIIWIQLRRLREHEFYRNFDPEKFIKNYFAIDDDTKIPKFDDCLFILDGWDEIQAIGDSRENYIVKILGNIIEKYKVLITSRPYAKLAYPFSVAKQTIEVKGFTERSKEKYIRTYIEFETPLKEEDVEHILEFIESREELSDMSNVPILLDILLYSWENIKNRNESVPDTNIKNTNCKFTMTKLYVILVLKLCNDIIEASNDNITSGTLYNIIESSLESEISVLSAIALKCIKQSNILISHDDLEPHSKTLTKTRFLNGINARNSNVERQKYEFLHLTICEFFAAIAILYGDRKEAEEFISKYKYNKRYIVVFTLITGLINEGIYKGRENETVESMFEWFFDCLDREPVDIFGWQHIYVNAVCMSEAVEFAEKRAVYLCKNSLSDRFFCPPDPMDRESFSDLLSYSWWVDFSPNRLDYIFHYEAKLYRTQLEHLNKSNCEKLLQIINDSIPEHTNLIKREFEELRKSFYFEDDISIKKMILSSKIGRVSCAVPMFEDVPEDSAEEAWNLLLNSTDQISYTSFASNPSPLKNVILHTKIPLTFLHLLENVTGCEYDELRTSLVDLLNERDHTECVYARIIQASSIFQVRNREFVDRLMEIFQEMDCLRPLITFIIFDFIEKFVLFDFCVSVDCISKLRDFMKVDNSCEFGRMIKFCLMDEHLCNWRRYHRTSHIRMWKIKIKILIAVNSLQFIWTAIIVKSKHLQVEENLYPVGVAETIASAESKFISWIHRVKQVDYLTCNSRLWTSNTSVSKTSFYIDLKGNRKRLYTQFNLLSFKQTEILFLLKNDNFCNVLSSKQLEVFITYLLSNESTELDNIIEYIRDNVPLKTLLDHLDLKEKSNDKLKHDTLGVFYFLIINRYCNKEKDNKDKHRNIITVLEWLSANNSDQLLLFLCNLDSFPNVFHVNLTANYLECYNDVDSNATNEPIKIKVKENFIQNHISELPSLFINHDHACNQIEVNVFNNSSLAHLNNYFIEVDTPAQMKIICDENFGPFHFNMSNKQINDQSIRDIMNVLAVNDGDIHVLILSDNEITLEGYTDLLQAAIKYEVKHLILDRNRICLDEIRFKELEQKLKSHESLTTLDLSGNFITIDNRTHDLDLRIHKIENSANFIPKITDHKYRQIGHCKVIYEKDFEGSLSAIDVIMSSNTKVNRLSVKVNKVFGCIGYAYQRRKYFPGHVLIFIERYVDGQREFRTAELLRDSAVNERCYVVVETVDPFAKHFVKQTTKEKESFQQRISEKYEVKWGRVSNEQIEKLLEKLNEEVDTSGLRTYGTFLMFPSTKHKWNCIKWANQVMKDTVRNTVGEIQADTSEWFLDLLYLWIFIFPIVSAIFWFSK